MRTVRFMEKNVSDLDGGIRIVLGVLLAIVYTGAAGFSVQAPLSYVILLLAVIMLVTGIVGFCPLYRVLGFSTKAPQSKEAAKKPK